ncbi:MAG: hypothetical protein WCK91_03170 [bacterium]
MDKNKINYWKLGFAIVITIYYIYYIQSDPYHMNENWNMIDGVDLLIHEAGHWIFSFFGEFITVLGGSLNQILIPCVFTGYFFLRREYYSASIVLFWVGQNILNVATYMGDSIVQQLPLLGGDGSNHDWAFLLTRMGVIQNTEAISSAFRDFGILVFIFAMLGCLYFSVEKRSQN